MKTLHAATPKAVFTPRQALVGLDLITGGDDTPSSDAAIPARHVCALAAREVAIYESIEVGWAVSEVAAAARLTEADVRHIYARVQAQSDGQRAVRRVLARAYCAAAGLAPLPGPELEAERAVAERVDPQALFDADQVIEDSQMGEG